MRLIIQRVKEAKVKVGLQTISEIGKGLLIFVGFENEDTVKDLEKLSKKACNLRIFDDENNVMNLSVKDVSGDILLVSQFTLHASIKKGNRPSYIKAAKAEIAVPLYEKFIDNIERELGKKVSTGKFGADMKISLINDGPVTIFADSKNLI